MHTDSPLQGTLQSIFYGTNAAKPTINTQPASDTVIEEYEYDDKGRMIKKTITRTPARTLPRDLEPRTPWPWDRYTKPWEPTTPIRGPFWENPPEWNRITCDTISEYHHNGTPIPAPNMCHNQ